MDTLGYHQMFVDTLRHFWTSIDITGYFWLSAVTLGHCWTVVTVLGRFLTISWTQLDMSMDVHGRPPGHLPPPPSGMGYNVLVSEGRPGGRHFWSNWVQ